MDKADLMRPRPEKYQICLCYNVSFESYRNIIELSRVPDSFIKQIKLILLQLFGRWRVVHYDDDIYPGIILSADTDYVVVLYMSWSK